MILIKHKDKDRGLIKVKRKEEGGNIDHLYLSLLIRDDHHHRHRGRDSIDHLHQEDQVRGEVK